MARKKINPLGPIRLTGIETKEPSKYAAGISGIQKAVEHTTSQMGASRAYKALNKLNQKHGIDCPGCAWPDPDDKRSVLGEYCKNGAKDYKNKSKQEVCTLTGKHFLQRFCLHILPHRFRKIRHYGFLANASKKKSLSLAKKALSISNDINLTKAQRKELAISRMFSNQANRCPYCQTGTMIIREVFAPNKDPPHLFKIPADRLSIF
jgi:hypothetical protein